MVAAERATEPVERRGMLQGRAAGKSNEPLLRMNSILCVVRELTDDSRRGAGRTTHKINWTKEHYRGGGLSQEQRCGTVRAI